MYNANCIYQARQTDLFPQVIESKRLGVLLGAYTIHMCYSPKCIVGCGRIKDMEGIAHGVL